MSEKEENKMQLSMEKKYGEKMIHKEPSYHFRKMNIFPSLQEIKTDRNNLLCPNIIRGSYRSVDHYLDVQFQLMREDFIARLRNGINLYFEQRQTKNVYRNDDILVIQNVVFLKEYNKEGKVCKIPNFKHNFDDFKTGSLVGFTKDKFNTMQFGTVKRREMNNLIVILKDQVVDNVAYIMIESAEYFLPYHYILKALQSMEERNFPFRHYIIDVLPCSKAPTYFSNNFKFANDEVLLDATWFNESKLDLNDSQSKALKMALTREFCLIQGPPGTGKTYVGLKITEVLVKCTSGPILVICYTNHALDQFLEGILSFTTRIIRVGGQSKNERLKDYNIKAARGRKPGHKIRSVLMELQFYEKELTFITTADGVVDIDFLETVINGENISTTTPWFAQRTFPEFIQWLLNADDRQHRSNEMTNMKVREYQRENIKTHDHEEQASKKSYSLDQMREEIQLMKDELTENSAPDEFEEIKKWEEDLQYLEMRLNKYKRNIYPPCPRTIAPDPFWMPPDDRWGLYFHYMHAYESKLHETIQRLSSVLEELRQTKDIELMRESAVIGMTTTGAARNRTLLEGLQCPTVIVEEAAEVLESHIVTALTSHCKHLIQIGDHQQLRPKTSCYRLAKQYNLEISLFERMIKNNMQCEQLEVQHRMRPEIARLIAPAIYPCLKNDASVYRFEPIRGVAKNLYFLNHSYEETYVEEGKSRQNVHEAEFVTSLARHLILQGYEPQQITILTTYSAQMSFFHRKIQTMPILERVNVKVLDDFQGEESEIILLSLVRSNAKNDIGFLRNENRVCVALSRAKAGLYMIGNMECLVSKYSIWTRVKKALEKKGNLVASMHLKCQVHADQITPVKSAEDFIQVWDGGCSLPCKEPLNCGHTCPKLCHVLDLNHLSYECRAPCKKILCEKKHVCPKLCSETCDKCTMIKKEELKCGHGAYLPCYMDPENYKCIVPVITILPCNHAVQIPCFEDPITCPCPQPCNKILKCGHYCKLQCHVKQDPHHLLGRCTEPCSKPKEGCVNGEHMCPNMCHEPCLKCEVLKRKSACGHDLVVGCEEDVDKIICMMKCSRKMKCGHICTKMCSLPCSTTCVAPIKQKCAVCRHWNKATCGEIPICSMCTK